MDTTYPHQTQSSFKQEFQKISQPAIKDSFLGKVYFQKYLLTKKLGEGSFGCIYKASTDSADFAFKIEKTRKHRSLLENEANIMSKLQEIGPGIPRIYSFCPGNDYNIMIMQLLGKSLEFHLHHLPSKKMSLKTVCTIAIQILSVLEIVHNNHYIHRDIKPDNFVVGLNNNANALYLIDFGLAKMFRDPQTLIQNEMIMRKKLTGTARYASIHALQGLEQSRRDDIESVAYVLLYLANGSLPWQGIVIKNKEDKYAKILEKKSLLTDEDLCKGLPKQFYHFVNYARNLDYEEEPKYYYMRSLFIDCLNERNLNYDHIYDWNMLNRAHSVKVKTIPQYNINNSSDDNENNEYVNINTKRNNNIDNDEHPKKKRNIISRQKTANYSTHAHKQSKLLLQHSISFSNFNDPHKTKTIINNYFTNNTNTIILKQPNSNNSIEHRNKNIHIDQCDKNNDPILLSSLIHSGRCLQVGETTVANNKSFKSHLTSKKRTSAYTLSTKTKKISSGMIEKNNKECNEVTNIEKEIQMNEDIKKKNVEKGKKGGCVSKCCIVI